MSALVTALPYIIVVLFLTLVGIVAAAVYSSQREDAWIFNGEDIEEVACGANRFRGEELLSVATPSRKSPLWRIHTRDGKQLITSEQVRLIVKPIEIPAERE